MFKRLIAVSVLLVAFVFASTAIAGWVPIAGKSNDIADGGDGTAYIVGSEAGGYGIYKRVDGDWEKIDGGKGMRLGADAEGNVWTVAENGSIKQYRPSKMKWRSIAGNATDIAVSSDGTAYIVGSEKSDFAIFKYDDGAFDIVGGFEGKAKRIAVAANGDLWVINQAGAVFQFRKEKGTWRPIAGKATDITAGSSGIFIVGSEAGGYGIYQWIDGDWEKLEGAAGKNIAASVDGKVWITTQENKIMQHRP